MAKMAKLIENTGIFINVQEIRCPTNSNSLTAGTKRQVDVQNEKRKTGTKANIHIGIYTRLLFYTVYTGTNEDVTCGHLTVFGD